MPHKPTKLVTHQTQATPVTPLGQDSNPIKDYAPIVIAVLSLIIAFWSLARQFRRIKPIVDLELGSKKESPQRASLYVSNEGNHPFSIRSIVIVDHGGREIQQLHDAAGPHYQPIYLTPGQTQGFLIGGQSHFAAKLVRVTLYNDIVREKLMPWDSLFFYHWQELIRGAIWRITGQQENADRSIVFEYQQANGQRANVTISAFNVTEYAILGVPTQPLAHQHISELQSCFPWLFRWELGPLKPGTTNEHESISLYWIPAIVSWWNGDRNPDVLSELATKTSKWLADHPRSEFPPLIGGT